MGPLVELQQLLVKNRTYRRFDNSRKIGNEQLRSLVGLCRYCASARNAQPLKYKLVIDPELCNQIFQTLGWAGYLTDWDGPTPTERPVAYIVQCLDTKISNNCLCDDGLHLQTITLGAVAMGLGCCIIKSFNAEKIKSLLHIDSNLNPLYVVALGYPIENVVITDMDSSDNFKYWRDDQMNHYVPKRSVDDLIL